MVKKSHVLDDYNSGLLASAAREAATLRLTSIVCAECFLPARASSISDNDEADIEKGPRMEHVNLD